LSFAVFPIGVLSNACLSRIMVAPILLLFVVEGLNTLTKSLFVWKLLRLLSEKSLPPPNEPPILPIPVMSALASWNYILLFSNGRLLSPYVVVLEILFLSVHIHYFLPPHRLQNDLGPVLVPSNASASASENSVLLIYAVFFEDYSSFEKHVFLCKLLYPSLFRIGL